MGNRNSVITSPFYRVGEWVWRFAYLNLLWLGFTLLGLGVLGVFPATVALFAVLRKWLMKNPDIAIFKLFWSSFKKSIASANILGYILFACGYIIWTNYRHLDILSGFIHNFVLICLGIATLLILLLVLFIFPVYVHFKVPLLQYFKLTLMIVLANPFSMIMLVIIIWITLEIFARVPPLIPFYLVSITGFLIMSVAIYVFYKIERKQEQIENDEYSLKYK